MLVGIVVLLYTSCTEHLQGERERRTRSQKLGAEVQFRIQCAFAEFPGDAARARLAFDDEISPGHLYPEFADWKLVTLLWELARVLGDQEARTHLKDHISAFSEIAVKPGDALEEEQLRETLSSLRSTIVRLFPGLPVSAARDASTLNVLEQEYQPMTFGSFEAVFFTAAFLVPGFVWSAVVSMLVPSRTASAQIRVVEFLTFSCINHGLWSWALFPVFTTGFLDQHPWWSGLILFAIMFLSPIGLGLASGSLQQKESVGRFLRRLGLRTVHPVPRAWDWHFSRLKPYWVMVTLKDGARLYGLFHSRSFAASDPDRRDLYLEAQFRPLETGEWAPVEDTGGVLIMADQIAAIEFRKVEGEQYES